MAVAISASEDDFKKTLPDVLVKPGLRINYTLSGNWQGEVDRWINGLGINSSTDINNQKQSPQASINADGNVRVKDGNGKVTTQKINM